MEAGASGDIAIAILRRNGTIGTPIYLWLGSRWVDFLALTAAQFSTYVDARTATDSNPNGWVWQSVAPFGPTDGQAVRQKVDGLTISKDQF